MNAAQQEPVAIGTAIGALAVAGIGLADVIWAMSDELVTSLNGFAAALIVVIGVVVRSKVTPV